MLWNRCALITLAGLATATPALAQDFNIDIETGGAQDPPSNALGAAAGNAGFWHAIPAVPGGNYTLKGLNGVLTGVNFHAEGTIIMKNENDAATGDHAFLLEDGWETVTASDSITVEITGLEAGAYFVFTYGDPPDSSQQETRVTIDGAIQNCGGTHGTNQYIQNVTHTRHMVEISAGEQLTIAITNNPNVGGSRAFLAGLQIQKLPRRLYVKPDATGNGDGLTWSDAFTDLQDALGAVSLYGGAIDEIWVAEGTYDPADVAFSGDSFHLPDGVALYGGFAGTETSVDQRDIMGNRVFLSGSIGAAGNADNSFHVVTAWGCGYDTILDGFTITSGNADGTIGWDMHGGAMWIRDSQLTIRNCIFSGNAGTQGGAIGVQDATPRFEDCYFFNNTAESGGAVYTVTGGAPKFVRCDFRFNSATDGGGGAIAHELGTNMHVFNCRFQQNHALVSGGAIRTANGNLTVANCLFVKNNAETGQGGAIYATEPDTYLFVYNSTACNNASWQSGGIAISGSSNGYVRNTILAANTDTSATTGPMGANLLGSTAATFSINYCSVQNWDGTPGGSGNYNGLPAFVDPDGADNVLGTLDDDFRLLPDADEVDAGSNSLLPSDAADVDSDNNVIEPLPLDLDDNPRRLDASVADTGSGTAPLVDIGAYEFVVSCPGDLDNDGDIDLDDLLIVLGDFGCTGGCDGDGDGNGATDLDDLLFVLGNFGTVCD